MRRTPQKTADTTAAMRHWSALYGPPEETKPHDLRGANAALETTVRQADSSTACAEGSNRRNRGEA